MVCTPACSASTECTASGCLPRYSQLRWIAPTNVMLYDVQASLIAELVGIGGRTPNDPAVLFASLNRPDGSVNSIALGRIDAGLFIGVAPLPSSGFYSASVDFPDAGLGVQVTTFTVDREPPVFSVTLEAPPTRVDAPPLIRTDPLGGGMPYYRRDETTRLRVLGTAGVTASSVQVQLLGILADGGRPATAVPEDSTACPPAADCAGQANFCRCYRVDLSRPALETVAGSMDLVVAGRTQGVPTIQTPDSGISRTPSVRVSRFKWKRTLEDAGSVVLFPPAVDANGDIYVPQVLGEKNLVALRHDGTTKWEVQTPLIYGGPTVGRRRVFIAVIDTAIPSLDKQDGGAFVVTCPNLSSRGPVTVMGDDVAAMLYEEMTLTDEGLLTIAPPATQCPSVSLEMPRTPGPFSMAARGDVVWGSVGPSVKPVRVTDGGALSTAVGFAEIPVAGTCVVTAAGVFCQDATSVSGSAMTGGAVTWAASVPSTLGRRAGILAEADGGIFSLWADGGTTTAVRFTSAGVGAGSVPTPVPMETLPAIGRGGVLHFTSQSGAIVVATRDFRIAWSASFPGSLFPSDVNLDCTRDGASNPIPGRPGVVYAISAPPFSGPATPNELYALITDSAGVDITAEWPMRSHDPRRTNNSATPLTEFSCP